jgi:hypothetical protein
MKKVFKYLIVFILSLFTLIIIVSPNDPAWVDCSNEKDLYRYVNDGWKVDKVLKNGDITYTDAGQKLFYVSEDPQIYLIKNNKIKVLNFGWRCWFEMGPELNYKS